MRNANTFSQKLPICLLLCGSLLFATAGYADDYAISSVRVGGQPGDQYIGPTCDNNGTYRTCFYITGSSLPTNAAAYTITVGGVPYTLAFLQVLSPQQVVACVIGIPGDGTQDVDVVVNAGPNNIYSAPDLFDAPKCTCEITAVRVAGQPGDPYIGPAGSVTQRLVVARTE